MAVDTQQRDHLLNQARLVRSNAYVPYSHYAVGAALLTAAGKVYTGVNIENAAYPMTVCGERTAIFKAVSEGEKEFVAIAVVTENGGAPCGACRQVMAEFAPDMQVFIAREDGTLDLETTVRDLLPSFFGPADLPRKGEGGS